MKAAAEMVTRKSCHKPSDFHCEIYGKRRRRNIGDGEMLETS